MCRPLSMPMGASILLGVPLVVVIVYIYYNAFLSLGAGIDLQPLWKRPRQIVPNQRSTQECWPGPCFTEHAQFTWS